MRAARPRRWRQWTIRARMAVVIVALCALALAATVVVASALLENVLVDRIDRQLLSTAVAVSEVEPAFLPAGPAQPAPPGDTPQSYVYDADGDFVAELGPSWAETDPPVLAGLDELASWSDSGEAHTVEDADGNSWRIVVESDRVSNDYIVFALSAEPVQAASSSLLLIGGTVSLGVLIVLAFCALWVVRIGLRPLDRMGQAAAAIAAGRLDERVPGDAHTETGRLGESLNTMLGRIQAALDARAASEERLRQFLADASHELRTPLTSIKGFAELYRRGGAPPGPVLDETIGRIEAESQRMRLLLDDLMLLAALDEERPLETGPVDLLGVAADVVGDAGMREPDRSITLEPLGGAADAGDGAVDDAIMAAVDIAGDEPRLRQVVANLVVNALRHTPPKATVAVRVGWGERAGPCLAQVGRTPAAPFAVVEVADTGPGVPAEHAAAVFERLYRIDPGRARENSASREAAGGGSGLGLSIVAAIATGHGGCVRLGDTPGGGATFRVLLPRGLRGRGPMRFRSPSGSPSYFCA